MAEEPVALWSITECVLCGSDDLERDSERGVTECNNCGSLYTDEGVRKLIAGTDPFGPLDFLDRLRC